MKHKTIIIAVVTAAAMAVVLVGCGAKIPNIVIPGAVTLFQ